MKAKDILSRGADILNQRGSEYETTAGGGERSFSAVATAFNAITGRDLHADEICLILSLVKDVRQYAQDRLHEDSVVDGVNYKALQGEELYKRYSVENKQCQN